MVSCLIKRQPQEAGFQVNVINQNILARRKQNMDIRLSRKSSAALDYSSPVYQMSDRVCATGHGGVPALIDLARRSGLCELIDREVRVLAARKPYSESDHVMAIVAATLSGGTCVESLRTMRREPELLDALGMGRAPDSTTSGDFLRRFDGEKNEALIEAVLAATVSVLKDRLTPEERRAGVIDADGTMAPTDSETMEGVDYSGHKRQWGLHPLLISLAGTGQPLIAVNRPGNASSAEGAAEYLDLAAGHMLQVYDRLLFRGDTDFSQSARLEGWHDTGRIDFVFGFDATPKLVKISQELDPGRWRELTRPRPAPETTRTKPENLKRPIVIERGFRTLRTAREDIAEFEYQPSASARAWRIVAVRKQIEVTQGQLELEPEEKTFFYITNLTGVSAEEIVRHANQRCNQENLIAQLKGQVHALSPVSNTIQANQAWMTIASLAWTLKSWFALYAPTQAESRRLLTMEFATFRRQFMDIAVQTIHTARRRVLKILGGHLPTIPLFLEVCERIRRLAPAANSG